MKMLAASEPEMAENLDSEAMDKLTGGHREEEDGVSQTGRSHGFFRDGCV